MRNGRTTTTEPTIGIMKAAQERAKELSPEATKELAKLVASVAGQYSYDDSAMLNVTRRRLRRAAERGTAWAVEVLALLTEERAQKVSV